MSRQERSDLQRVETQKFYQSQVEKFETYIAENEEVQNIIKELVNEGKISNDDVLNSLKNEDIYILYCYANRPVKSVELNEPRKYPAELQEMGFIRLPVNSPVYITTSSIINSAYRDTSSLKTHITHIVRRSLIQEREEWIKILKKKENPGVVQREFIESPFEKTMKANILVLRSKISEVNFDSINEIIFSDNVMKLFRSHGAKFGIKISKEKKGRVKDFILKISLEPLLEDLKEIKEPIITNEQKIKKNLGINSIIDYTFCEEEDLKRELEKYVPYEKAIDFTKQIIIKSNSYKKAMKKLGIPPR